MMVSFVSTTVEIKIPPGNLLQFAIENGPFIVDLYLLYMVIFHSHVSLPEGTLIDPPRSKRPVAFGDGLESPVELC